MRILIDTNIYIFREDYHVIPLNLQALLQVINDLGAKVLIHPLSVQEIERDKNQERKEINLSKIQTYVVLHDPPKMDASFISTVGRGGDDHDNVDNNLIFCVLRDAVDFLITEDDGIHRKSSKLGLSDRVFRIDEALEYFKKRLVYEDVHAPPQLLYIPVHNLDVNDPIFSSLKEEYDDFLDWFQKISRQGRKAWVYYKQDNHLGAVLICKIEDEAIPSNPPLGQNRRLKICTFKVDYSGYKLGEQFIKISTEFAIKNNINELYLTHFLKNDDELVNLITEFGFHKVAQTTKGEDVFLKRTQPDIETDDPVCISREYHPSFYDSDKVLKFVVPILPIFHNRLFTDYRAKQLSLLQPDRELITEGNTIKKAYLSGSKTKRILPGSILLFYRSHDEQNITSLGIVEQIYNNISSSEETIRLVGKRSVYTKNEIDEMVKKPLKVILFRHHFHLSNPITLKYLLSKNIIAIAPPSITHISHESYLKIKKAGGIDERFTFS